MIRLLQALILCILSLQYINAADLNREEIRKLLGTPKIEDIVYPKGDAALRVKEIQLGKQLFFDVRLSKNDTVSCATCHNPKLGFSDGLATGLGVTQTPLPRNAPHLFNLAWNTSFFWDGRSDTLEEQVLGPIESKDEMGMPINRLISKLSKITEYKQQITDIYNGADITEENLTRAIAQFERSIITNNSSFDAYLAGDDNVLSTVEKKGMQLFVGKAKCVSCHSGPNFTDQKFHNIGVQTTDKGRAKFDKEVLMLNAFKTPGLRNITLSAPYMHNGSVKDLQAVIELYRAGGNVETNDPDMGELDLSEEDVRALIAFLGALTER